MNSPAFVVALRVMFSVWRRSRRERISFGDALERERNDAWHSLTDEEKKLVQQFARQRRARD